MALDPLEVTGGLAIGVGLGGAITDTVEPRLRKFKFEQSSKYLYIPLSAATAAEVAAEDVDRYGPMETEAGLTGYSPDRFKNLYGVTLTAPGMGELLTALRRKTIAADDFTHGLRKAKLEMRWDDALAELQHVRLTPQQVALGIVRSVIADPGLLATTLDLAGGIVPAYPVWSGDALAEAEAGGIDRDRLRVMVGEIGLPMSAQQAASAYFRQIIHLGDFNRAILEGDTRPEWAPFILDQARQILSANEYQEAALRGVLTPAEADAKTAQHGMSAEDTRVLFEILGRPLAVHQITTGLARGGEFGGTYADVPEPYRDAIRRSNIRPEYARLAYANRYSYPSAFVLRSLAQAGDLTQTEAEAVLLDIGWPPALALKVSERWTTSTASGSKELLKGELIDEYEGGFITESELRDHLAALGYAGPELDLEVHLGDARRIKGWRDKGITALGKRYVASTMDAAAADTYLQDLGVVDAGTRGQIIRVWDLEREFK